MSLIDLLEPQNLIYALPFLGALFYLLMMTAGVVTHDTDVDFAHDADIDHDIDLDHDFDVDHDIDLDHDIGFEHDADLDHGAEFDHDHDVDTSQPGFLLRALSVLGVGRIPISLIIMSFCFIWGVVGITANTMLDKLLFHPVIYIGLSVVIAFVVTTFTTRMVALGLSKIMPSTESYGSNNADLVGKKATAKYTVTDKSGAATVYDEYHNLQTINCHTTNGDVIPPNQAVVITKYNQSSGDFIVRRDPLTKTKE